jgi:hypothetical protein
MERITVIWSPVKEKLTRALGPRWNLRAVARTIGCDRTALGRVVQCTGKPDCQARHTPNIQDDLAKLLGTSTRALFGPHTWFRLAAGELHKRERRVIQATSGK